MDKVKVADDYKDRLFRMITYLLDTDSTIQI